MNFVYIVMVKSLESGNKHLHGVYSTKEKAERVRDRLLGYMDVADVWIDWVTLDDEDE